jgi:hypothetical protein
MTACMGRAVVGQAASAVSAALAAKLLSPSCCGGNCLKHIPTHDFNMLLVSLGTLYNLSQCCALVCHLCLSPHIFDCIAVTH